MSRDGDATLWPFRRSNGGGTTALVVAAIVCGVLAVGGNDVWWHVGAGAFAILFGFGAWRYSAIVLAAGPSGVVVQNSVRRWTFEWSEVDRFESAPSASATGSGAAVRVVRHDGTGVTAMAGARLGADEVERDVAWLNDYRREQQEP